MAVSECVRTCACAFLHAQRIVKNCCNVAQSNIDLIVDVDQKLIVPEAHISFVMFYSKDILIIFASPTKRDI